MQLAVEVLTAEKQMLTAEHAKTKGDLKSADKRLIAAELAMAELQRGLKGTQRYVGKLHESVVNMEQDTESKILPTIMRLTSDLQNLDTAHSMTAQSVHDTNLFTDRFHRAFHNFEDNNEQRNNGHNRKFQHVEDRFTQLERTLKDMQDVMEHQSENLNKIDGVIGPVKVKLHNLEIDRKWRLNENYLTIPDPKVASRSMGVDVAKFVEICERCEELSTAVGSLERMFVQNTENIRHLLDTTEDHTRELRKSNNRTTCLEKAINSLQDDKATHRLLHQTGPSMDPGADVCPAPSPPSPEATSSHHENAEHRILLMENQMKATQDDVKTMRASLDLSHSYWKGLTRGFKDTNVEVKQEGKVLPNRANLVRLPAMVSDPSC
jgi:hypothetical protein